jgi:uncharacterized protein YybS (DUF2232 family)
MTPKARPALVLVETAFLASCTTFCFLITFYFFVPLSQNFYPLPPALAYLRWGSRSSVMTVTVASLLVFILMGPTRSLQFLIPHGLLGVLLGCLWRRGVPWAVSISLGTIVAVAGTIFQLALLSVLIGENIWTFSIAQATNFLNWLWQVFGSLDQPDENIIQFIAGLSIVARGLINILLSHILAWLLFDRLEVSMPAPPKWLESLLD